MLRNAKHNIEKLGEEGTRDQLNVNTDELSKYCDETSQVRENYARKINLVTLLHWYANFVFSGGGGGGG